MAGKPGDAKHWWNPDNLRDVGESVGLSQLNTEAIQALQEEVEYRVFMVIQEAKRFMIAGKRTVLHTTDITQALKVLEVEPLYGYESTRPLRFGEASLGPGQPLFYIEDEEVDFEKLINAPLPKVPKDMSLSAHWLAVEGVQPSIPQNPPTADTKPGELYHKGNAQFQMAVAGMNSLGFKPQVKHVVSKEQRAFFDQTVADIINEEDSDEAKLRREKAYQAIRGELGIQQLVVYYVGYISDKITHNITSIFIGRVMMDLIKALIDNDKYHLDPYISALVPPIITTICADRPISEIGEHNVGPDYELRRMASQLLGELCRKFDHTPDKILTLRAANTCLLAITTDIKKPMATYYGAIVGYTNLLSVEGTRTIFVEQLPTFEILLARGRQEGHYRDVDMVVAAIMEALSKISRNPPPMMMMANGVNHDVDVERRRERLAAAVGATIADKIISSGDEILEKAILWKPKDAFLH